jgi:uncharacterized protein YjbI with pentapeptide repeats
MIRLFVLSLIVELLTVQAHSADTSQPCPELSAPQQAQWKWSDRGGRVHDGKEFEQIRQNHQQWLTHYGLTNYAKGLDDPSTLPPGALEDPLRANLAGAELVGLALSGNQCNHLDLRYAELTGADFTNAKLDYADFSYASLNSADFSGASLDHASFAQAQLESSHFWEASLQQAVLTGANLSLIGNGKDTDFTSAKLKGAQLHTADLTGAFIYDADLSDADLTSAKLSYAFYLPRTPPSSDSIARALGLQTLRWNQNPFDELETIDELEQGENKYNPTLPQRWLIYIAAQNQLAGSNSKASETTLSFLSTMFGGFFKSSGRGITAYENFYPLLNLRNSLKGAGYHDAEVQTNLAYQRHVQSSVQMLIFDWTCEYGAAPARPLFVAAVFWLLSIPIYWAGFRFSKSTNLVRVDAHDGKEIETPLNVRNVSSSRFRQEMCLLKYVGLFSVISIVNLGFDGFDFGRWVRMLFWNDYDLKARGWLRMVAGLQSLVGLGLLALSLLSFFGHPME